MDANKRKRLESRGWVVGEVDRFLGLEPEEAAYIDLKVALSKKLRDYRKRKRITQTALAKAIGSSQSRVAKMEAGDPAVSIDLLVKSLLSLGVTTQEIGRALQG